jgi:hypothetical protein
MDILSKIWSALSSGEPSAVAAVIGVAGAIVGGLLGALVGGLVSIWAVDRTHRKNLERESAALARQQVGFVQALQAEVEGLWVAFETEMGPAIRSAGAAGLARYFPVTANFFVVYPANAFLLGQIDDLELRKAIVQLYLAMGVMIDAIKLNNSLFAASDQARSMFQIYGASSAPVSMNLQMQAAERALAQYGSVIKNLLQALEDFNSKFFKASNRWLGAHGAKTNEPPQVLRPEAMPPLAS